MNAARDHFSPAHADVVSGKTLYDPQDDAAQKSAEHVADAAKSKRYKGFETPGRAGAL